MIGSRTPSTMKLKGLYSAIVLAGSSIRSCGKKAEERKRTTRTSGNSPWTTLALPLCRAIAAPMPPTARAEAVISAIARSAPGTPPSMSAPKIMRWVASRFVDDVETLEELGIMTSEVRAKKDAETSQLAIGLTGDTAGPANGNGHSNGGNGGATAKPGAPVPPTA